MNASSSLSPDPRPEADRLLAEAMAADAAGDSDRSLQLLRDSVSTRHLNPAAHYLLGTELASRGLNGDAVLHLATAVEQAPGLSTARLQLGLLWLTLDNPRTAQAVFAPLSELPDTSALHHFGDALSRICVDDLDAARIALQRGLEIGCDNAPLMRDMNTMLERLRQARHADASAELRSLQHGMAISAYAGGEPFDR